LKIKIISGGCILPSLYHWISRLCHIQKKKYHVKNKLVSLVDKDARHGAKSDKKTFTGYKANVMKSHASSVRRSFIA
jgi:hypothetical protein